MIRPIAYGTVCPNKRDQPEEIDVMRIQRARRFCVVVLAAAMLCVGASAFAVDPASGLAINGLKLTLRADPPLLKMTAPGNVETPGRTRPVAA